MIQVVWEFRVRAGAAERFEQTYGPDGVWARLFEVYPGFRGTTLLRDTAQPDRYLTIDAWDNAERRRHMLTHARARYAQLDEACAALTEQETEVGVFDVAGDA
jgi:heme-degrading monooxygenase HmoA